MTPDQMVSGIQKIVRSWKYDVVSIGYPGPVLRGVPVADPYNLGTGWVGFDYQAAFDRPVRLINDAAMQAMRSYVGGKMLFLGLGTGLGSAPIVDGILAPTELGPSPVQERCLRGLCRKTGAEKKRHREVAIRCRRCRAAANLCASAR